MRRTRAEGGKGALHDVPPMEYNARDRCLCTREKFATETMAAGLRSVYTKHDWHELCSGADRKGLEKERGRRIHTRGPHSKLKYNCTAKYVWRGTVKFMPAAICVHTRVYKCVAVKCMPNAAGRRRRVSKGVPGF